MHHHEIMNPFAWLDHDRAERLKRRGFEMPKRAQEMLKVAQAAVDAGDVPSITQYILENTEFEEV